MRIAILGAGAIGGYFGGRLVEAGEDVTFLVRPERKARLLQHGLRIESVYGDATLPVTARTADELTEPFDVVLLTCKAYDLDAAIDAIRPAVGPGTAVLPLLNGLAHIDRLNREFGEERLLVCPPLPIGTDAADLKIRDQIGDYLAEAMPIRRAVGMMEEGSWEDLRRPITSSGSCTTPGVPSATALSTS